MRYHRVRNEQKEEKGKRKNISEEDSSIITAHTREICSDERGPAERVDGLIRRLLTGSPSCMLTILAPRRKGLEEEE